MQSERERQSVRTLATEMEQENDRVKLIRLWREREPRGERVRKPKEPGR